MSDVAASSRIFTTHVGSLPRQVALLDLMKANIDGQDNQAELDSAIRQAVSQSVEEQVAGGIDIVTDGEQSKTGFFFYVRERIEGFEPRPGAGYAAFDAEVEAFPEYYKHYFGEAMLGGNLTPFVPVACTGPVRYVGLPQDKIRYHTCYSINEGPRIHDVPFIEFVRFMLRINASNYSFEAGNVRHEHEYHLWEQVKLPEGKRLIPGVICHASNTVEHPELIAERLVRFAERVGRDNVIASVDCGFSSQATYRTEVHPTVIREKFRALRAGAALASERLWRD
ncbi:methionine synthase [Candidatus Sodalis pierantonius]|uniref:methionine synthase n=1 Tax=Candidatus Sodalis pierantonii TaxID=1486991 RepID=UPI00046CAF8E|nr:methionine synthase [Candidatus Sodalis pierantonius]